MKKLLPVFFLLMLAAKSQSQNGAIQAGPVLTFFGKSETNYGGELIANFPIQKTLSAGAGIQLLKDNTQPNLYVPVFATFKVSVPSKKIVYFPGINPGININKLFLPDQSLACLGMNI